MQLFYNPNIKEKDKQVIFSKDESKHITKVLRKKEGDVLKVTNGEGFLFNTEIIKINANQCLAKIVNYELQPKSKYHLHMAVAPTKMNDRYEWFLEKATEIGVQEITPIICDHSERKVVKLNRYERVLQSAMKQSLHFRIPKLNEPVRLTDFLKTQDAYFKYIAHCEDAVNKNYFQNLITAQADICILIGPEGDFSEAEIKEALQNGWNSISLGNTRLRTETAAIVACHTVALKNQI